MTIGCPECGVDATTIGAACPRYLDAQATLKAALENRGAATQAAALSRILGAVADRIAASVVAR